MSSLSLPGLSPPPSPLAPWQASWSVLCAGFISTSWCKNIIKGWVVMFLLLPVIIPLWGNHSGCLGDLFSTLLAQLLHILIQSLSSISAENGIHLAICSQWYPEPNVYISSCLIDLVVSYDPKIIFRHLHEVHLSCPQTIAENGTCLANSHDLTKDDIHTSWISVQFISLL